MKCTRTSVLLLSLAPSSLFLPQGLSGQQDQEAVDLQLSPVRGGVYMIAGAGGNIAAFFGEDGVLLVDAGMPEFSSQIQGAVGQIAGDLDAAAQVEYLVNTHWHLDHTGGNPAFGQDGATVLAHEGVLPLVSEDQVLAVLDDRAVPALAQEGWPTLTFNDRLNLRWNRDLIHLVHMPTAHSNGDVIVHFRDADIVHTGDLFFNGMYPFIDVDHGGSIEGMVNALEDVLSHSRANTLFIPGHGPLADRSDLERYLAMLRTVSVRVRGMMEDGMSKEQIITARPTAEYDAEWGNQGGFTVPEVWVGLVYESLARAR